jgi:hypothetical protein
MLALAYQQAVTEQARLVLVVPSAAVLRMPIAFGTVQICRPWGPFAVKRACWPVPVTWRSPGWLVCWLSSRLPGLCCRAVRCQG